MIFFNATAEATLSHAIFSSLRNPGAGRFSRHPLEPAIMLEMHARLPQSVRSNTTKRFRDAESAIMFTSDVSARGMDFPNVTHVIQVGLPKSRQTYIHRLGRTARIGKGGEGWLILNELEEREMPRRLKRLPLQVERSLRTADVDMAKDADLPAPAARALTQVVEATKLVQYRLKAAAYKATLGTYTWFKDKQLLLDKMNDRARHGWALAKPPAIDPYLVSKLGLENLDGLQLLPPRAIDYFGGASRPPPKAAPGDGWPSTHGSRWGDFQPHRGRLGRRDGSRGSYGGRGKSSSFSYHSH
jgi:ATP-dependent RNA helicase MSS116, mitochondrial